MALDLGRILAVLNRHRVAFVLIGGLAAVYHGSPFPTEDADIAPDTDHANLARLAETLRELNARVRTEAVPEGVPFACDAEGLAAAETWNLVTDAGDLDLSFRAVRHAATRICAATPSVRKSMTSQCKSHHWPT